MSYPEIEDPALRELAEELHRLPHFQPDKAWKARLKAKLLMRLAAAEEDRVCSLFRQPALHGVVNE